MSETIAVARVIPARAERIFNAWLDATEHGKMTGSGATSGPDGAFTAWDGYISGKTLATEPHAKIVQSWRTTEFPEGAPDSMVTVSLEEVEGGTRVTLTQEQIPDGQKESYAKGWDEFYFDPMTRYFGTPGSQLKGVGEAIGEAAKEAVEKTEAALESAEKQLEATAKDVVAAVEKARVRARKQAVKAVKVVKKVRKTATARAKAVQRSVKKLLKGAKKKKAAPPAKKKAVRKAAAPRRAKVGAAKKAKKGAAKRR